MIGSFIYAVGGFIEAIIGLRFLLRLLGANPSNDLVQWIYQWSTPFVSPFAGIFGQNATVTGRGVVTTSVFDWTALIAFVVVGVILALLGRIFYHSRAIV
jgi:YggT family protein